MAPGGRQHAADRPREDAGRIGRAAATLGEGDARRAGVRPRGRRPPARRPALVGASTPPSCTGCSTRSARPPAIAVVVLGYFVGMVANTIPLPGAVSGGMVGVLLAFGVEADLALASVLSYRALAIWLPAPVGLAALGGLRRTVARWGAEERPARRPRPAGRAAPPGLAPAASPPERRHELRARTGRPRSGHRARAARRRARWAPRCSRSCRPASSRRPTSRAR